MAGVYLVIAQTGNIGGCFLGSGLLFLIGRIGLEGIGIAYTLAHFLVAVVVAWPLWKALKEEKVGGYRVL